MAFPLKARILLVLFLSFPIPVLTLINIRWGSLFNFNNIPSLSTTTTSTTTPKPGPAACSQVQINPYLDPKHPVIRVNPCPISISGSASGNVVNPASATTVQPTTTTALPVPPALVFNNVPAEIKFDTPVDGTVVKLGYSGGPWVYKDMWNTLTVGCFKYDANIFANPSPYDTFEVLTPAQYAEPFNNKTGNFDPALVYYMGDCWRRCGDKGSYTYAGQQMGYDATCYCFNNISRMTKGYCTGCGYFFSVADNMVSIVNCQPSVTSNNLFANMHTMFVQGTCNNPGAWGPPNCINRAKATCATLPNLPMTTYDGKCLKCTLPNSGIYSNLSDNCDVLQENQPIEDYRLTPANAITILGVQYKSFYQWSDDFNVTVPFDRYSLAVNFLRSQQSAASFADESKLAKGVSIKASAMFVSFFQAQKRYYLRHFMFKASSLGAFYFSLWNMIGGTSFSLRPSANNNLNVYQNDDSDKTLNMVFGLLAKYKFDVQYNQTATVKDLNLPVTLAFGQDPKFGYHCLDTKKTWGGTGSMQEINDQCSLRCQTIYASGYTMADIIPNSFLFNFKSWSNQDTIPGWDVGTRITTARSDRPWWAAHQWDLTTNNAANLLQYGQRAAFAHYDDCPLKVVMAVACPDGCDRQQCDTNGLCTSGCIQGLYGPRCDQRCPVGKYGQNCQMNCSVNCQQKLCQQTSGLCLLGCIPGYFGASCAIPCVRQYYGPDCMMTCSENCATPSTCSSADGTCLGGCTYGYLPPLCALPCPNGTYGTNCSLTCGKCKGGEGCLAVTGMCPGSCVGNYMPPYCQCLAGTWGNSCTKSCGNCRGLLPCRVTDGVCDGAPPPGVSTVVIPTQMCEPGFQPPMCVCKNQTWGDNCQSQCGGCLYGFCMSDTGFCLAGCNAGVQGVSCSNKCAAGAWGKGCINACGACKAGTVCDSATGACPQGCATGYNGSQCVLCVTGYWGDKCQNPCGHCRNNQACDFRGYCPFNVTVPPSIIAGGGGGNIGVPVDVALSLINSAINSADTDLLVTIIRYMCEDGFQPISCVCKSGFYGPTCSQQCSNCVVGCIDNGTCLGSCVAGYAGPQCNISCPASKYGPNCKFSCGHCYNNTACTAADGICKQGCDPGYMLPNCVCPYGYFGIDCKRVCGNCAAGTTCSFVDGSCLSGCQPGWKEPYCNCTVGTYRLDCSGKCGNCAGTKDCDLMTGACQYGCNASSIMPLCVLNCAAGTYGPGCRQTCGYCSNCEVCDPATGACKSGCEPGYQEPTCASPCPPMYYGSQCKQKCGYCYGGVSCNAADGVCDKGCVMGYLSPYCSQACPNKTWGFNCQNMCGFCFNGSSCNYLDGRCNGGCVTGFNPPFCSAVINVTADSTTNACPAGYYLPPLCKTPCGQCLSGQKCNGLVGYCPMGCSPGFQPILCNSPCLEGVFGANCMEVCGRCAGPGNTKVACRGTDGVCTSGCQPGWFGDTCKYKSADEAAAAKAGAGRIGLFQHLLFDLLLVVLFLRN